jgi:hypothetical protein
MRRLLLITAAAALLAGPAIAVDYVQCREMLRTKNELSSLAAKKEVEYEGTHALPTECSGWMLDEASKQGCSDALAREVGKRKVYMTVGSRKIYSAEAAGLFNASLKVAGDMNKAGCPYQ